MYIMKTILLIPYRDREEQLKYFLENSVIKLKKKIPDLEVLIIEQSKDNRLFNRGKILNVGFKYYDNDEYNYITQDVDTNPTEYTMNFYKYNCGNGIISIYSSHNSSLGGIIKFKGSTYRIINGFKNNIWGWGLEDKDFFYRSLNSGIKINRIPKKKVKFTILSHSRPHSIFSKLNSNLRKEVSKIFEIKKGKWTREKAVRDNYIMRSGLNNLEYEILEEDYLKPYVKKIVVKI